MTHPPDNTLAARVAKGDQQAFLSLYDRYASRVYALALRIMGETMTAEEITQDVFIKLWTRAHRYQPGHSSFVSWLLTIARNTALDRLRGERRRPPLADDLEPEDLWETLGDGRSPSDEAEWHSLYFAVQALPPEQRQVIELAFYYGLSHSEIADYLDRPIGTVKTRLYLGMEKLRRQWLEEDVAKEKTATGLRNV